MVCIRLQLSKKLKLNYFSYTNLVENNFMRVTIQSMNSKECMFDTYSGQGCAKCGDCPCDNGNDFIQYILPFQISVEFCIHYHSKGFNTFVSIHPNEKQTKIPH